MEGAFQGRGRYYRAVPGDNVELADRPIMLFRPLDIPGVFLIELEKMEDERGFFSRLFCSETFLEQGLCANYPQWSVSFNGRRGTLRGLHFQAPPHEEIKLVSCTRGAVFDVAVDVRPGSPSRGKWVGVELSADNRQQHTFPPGLLMVFKLSPMTPRYAITYPKRIGRRRRAACGGMIRISSSHGRTSRSA